MSGKLFLHTCCAPCATYTVQHWRGQGWQVTSFWYNPNIHPYTEHQRRLETLRQWCRDSGLHLTEVEGYDMVQYFRRVVGHEADRCGYCFRLRLERAALEAKAGGFDAFSTTLLISPYQKHELLRQVGEAVAQEVSIPFLYQDLRPGYRQSRQMAVEKGLYRQKYCGCVYSEWERFGKVDIGENCG